MINEAMFYDKEKLNHFTKELKARCVKSARDVLVKLRNGTLVYVEYRKSNPEEYETEGFMTPDDSEFCGCWYPDGSSLTSNDYDIVAINSPIIEIKP